MVVVNTKIKNTCADVESTILQILSPLASNERAIGITPESRLKNDLGLDSLNMMELCVALEGVFDISINESITQATTVQDLIRLVNSDGGSQSQKPYNLEDYPLPKTKKHVRHLKLLMRLSRFVWRFKIAGLENIPSDSRYILCPNHQSHFDSLWVWAAIGYKRVDLRKICCFAKHEHLSSKSSRFMLSLLGGIPVDRDGNTVPAMQRGLASIQEGRTMLIHPEGTRTLDGKMQAFKGGAAKLAIDAGVPVIPVRIDGAWDIFPPHRKRPKTFRFGRRHPINISFGKPIMSDGKGVDELTSLLQSEVERMGVVV